MGSKNFKFSTQHRRPATDAKKRQNNEEGTNPVPDPILGSEVMPWSLSTNRRDEPSDRDAALSQLWDATRPVEPDDAAWDAIWARVRERIDPPTDAPLKLPARPWRRTAVAVFLVAQAAALLAAVVIWNGHRHTTQTPVAKAAPVARGTIDIVPGQIVMIHAEGTQVRAEMVAIEEDSSVGLVRFGEFEDFYVMFNEMEGRRGTQLAQND